VINCQVQGWRRWLLNACALLTMQFIASCALALDMSKPFSGEVALIDRAGKELIIGNVEFSGFRNGQSGFAVNLESPRFSDHFLSMRPFRCLEGEQEWFCHMTYTYKLRRIISKKDLRDLSYSLLFIRKTPAEFGIDAWNGLYYDLTFNDDGSISGELLEGDLNVLASPPEKDYSHPIEMDNFIKANKKKRLYPNLIIRPQS
jgi:hypothetical protein